MIHFQNMAAIWEVRQWRLTVWRTCVLVLLALLTNQVSDVAFIREAKGHDTMVTSNVIHRTFYIRWRDSTGTAFAIDRDGKQYLVTARHVVGGIQSGDEIQIYAKNEWREITVNVVGTGKDEVDITVLACPLLLARSDLPLPADLGGVGIGQSVLFLGFPFGWFSDSKGLSINTPLPFVKAGIVSAITFEEPRAIYIDGHGNKGFSGGPVVFVRSGNPHNRYQVGGVVSNYPTPILEPVRDKYGDPLLDSEGRPFAYFAENPGFVVAQHINYATEMIDSNPIGYPLPVQ